MSIAAEFNPTVLMNLLVGASGAAGRRNPGPILTSIRKDLRDEIEKALPVIYLWDANVIVNSVLESLNPNTLSDNRTLDLSRFLSGVQTSTGISSFYEYERDNKTNKIRIKEKADAEVLSLFATRYNRLVSSKQFIISKVHRLILNTVPNTVDVDLLIDSIVAKQAQLSKVVAEIHSLGVPTNTLQSARFTKVIRATGRDIKKSTSGNRVILEAQKLLPDFVKEEQVLIVSSNFNVAKKLINDNITKLLVDTFKRFGISVKDKSTGFKAGNFSAAGHSGFISGNIQGINTPQLQAASMLMAMAGKEDPGLVNRFINGTDHSKWVFKIDKEYGSKLQKVLSLGISLVRSQPAIFNSGVLSTQETSVINEEMQSILNSSYKDALAYMQKQAANNKDFHNYLISVFRMSPTVKEGVALAILDTILGKTTSNSRKSKSGFANLKLSNFTNTSALGLVKSSVAGTSNKKNAKKVNVPKPQQSAQTNLSSLMMLINSNLQNVISANMGDGDQTKILNYRTGRFAASAKVERMSESRAGMITAFYSYMKNPYQTFEPGYAQGKPATRDPKLLVSKSIRDIAATRVGNRMRAISI